MKSALTPVEVTSLFKSLRKETFNYFGYSHDGPLPFKITTFDQPSETAMAQTEYDWTTPPKTWIESVYMEPQAVGVEFNNAFLPYLYEDEVICTILHELCHVVAGYNAGHGPHWSALAWEIGSVGLPVGTPRNLAKMTKDGVFSPYTQEALILGGVDNWMPTLCNSVED